MGSGFWRKQKVLFCGELIQAGGEILWSEVHKLIVYVIRKTCLINGKSVLLYQLTLIIITVLNLIQNLILIASFNSKSIEIIGYKVLLGKHLFYNFYIQNGLKPLGTEVK
jgi:uncharacterized Tic20 family protein